MMIYIQLLSLMGFISIAIDAVGALCHIRNFLILIKSV